ncbi:MAG: TRAP transporter small permease [Betaproteobacteria bacterium]|nr:TRAP transporter small permease [Betaproteobacteria bacterium]
MLARLEAQTLRAARWLALGACSTLLVISIVTLVDVLLRWLFSAPIRGFFDFAGIAMAVAGAACFPALLAQRGNISVRFVGKLLGPRATRVLDAFGALVTLAFFVAMAWQYVYFTIDLARSGERLPILQWQVWPWWTIVTLMIGASALVAAIVLLFIVRGHVSGEAAEPDS